MLSAFQVNQDFKLEIIRTRDIYFPRASATTEFTPIPSQDNQIPIVKIYYSDVLFRETLLFELGHVKLACMGVPMHFPGNSVTPTQMYYLVLVGEYYDWLLISEASPDDAIELMQEQAHRIPPQSNLLSLSMNMPTVFSNGWYAIMGDLTRTSVNAAACNSIPSLTSLANDFNNVLALFGNTSAATFMTTILRELSSLPPLPPSTESLPSGTRQAIIDSTDRIYRMMYPGSITPITSRYHLSCRRPRWKIWRPPISLAQV